MVDDSTVPILKEELFEGVFKAPISGTSDVDANSHCYISGDREVTVIGAAETEANVRQYLGYTLKDFKYGYDALVTLQTKFRNLVKFVAGDTITAGLYVKFEYSTGAITGQVIPWVPGTDDADQIIGICWFGGVDTGTVEILTL